MSIQHAFSDVLREKWSNVQLFIDLRHGIYTDLSSYTRSVTITDVSQPNPYWVRSKYGVGMRMGLYLGAANPLTVSDASGLRLQQGSLIAFLHNAFGESVVGAGGARVFFKRVNGTCSYDMYAGSTTTNLYDGTNIHTLTHPWSGCFMSAWTFVNGRQPIAYRNGVLISPSGTNGSFSGTDTGALYIGNSSSGGANMLIDWSGFIIVDVALTSNEIGRLTEDWLRSKAVWG